MRDALDAAWGDFPTDDIGYDWLRYTGNARPSSEWVRLVNQHSRVTFVQETNSTRSQEGFQAGVYDCQFAEERARAVMPNVASIAVVVSDGNYADSWDASEYGRGWAAVATLPFFPYGAVPICESFIRGAGVNVLNLRVTWVPETWGAGTGLSQVVGYSPLPNTDLNRVWAPYYPSSTPAPSPPPTPVSEEDNDVISVQFKSGIDSHMWVGNDKKLRFRNYDGGVPGAIITVPARNGADYAITDPKPLVATGFGATVVVYAAGDQEAMVTPTGFGPIIDIL